MNIPKVLIHVVGGIAHWSSTGDVDVVVVDEDKIRAGDPPVRLSREWQVLASDSLEISDSRFVRWI